MSSSTTGNQYRVNPYRRRMYDVFISVNRQQPRRQYFTSRLCGALMDAGVHVCDEILLKTGDFFFSQSVGVLGGIEGSRVSVIILTKEYLNSAWCFQELLKIMECRSSKDQVVVPVFCGVDPSEVEVMSSLDGKLAPGHITTLQEILHISPSFVTASGKEMESIKSIVEHVTFLLYSRDLFVAEHPVGVKSRVQDLIQILNYHEKPNDVLVLGIWGMGGAGKTTIAKALYNKIRCKFEVRKFIPDIGERMEQNKMDSLASLQDDIAHCMSRKKLLLILDNVAGSNNELEDLLLSHTFFGPGSVIIITTRNKQPLHLSRADHIYRVKEMDYNECVELFSWCAFKKATPERTFAGLIKEAVEYSDGLPLALVAVGCVLSGRSIEEWGIVLDRVKIFPIQDVQEVLKISINYLDHKEKQVFLEIAYLSHVFSGMYLKEAMQILNVNGFEEILGLERQSLVTFDENKLHMHPLLQEIGREIYQKESSSFNPQQKIYDVFLSFRGIDTRSTFTSHLHTSLENAGIYVFKDDDGLQRGEKVSISLLKAIEESKISIIILSLNYPNSKWCLKELEAIMLCHKNKAQKVLPVFYYVNPSEVRNQTGKFGRAFKSLIKRIPKNEVNEKSWRAALKQVGCISGIAIQQSRNESEAIKNIIEQVTRMLDMKDLFVVNHPVGVELRVEEVISMLKNQKSKDPVLLGIWGMGGIGKTTIAKAVYNKICREFEGRCFLLNVREVWDQDNGGVHLQQQLLSSIFQTTKIKIQNIESGKAVLEERLGKKKILVVLDDVDKMEQLNALAANRKWFCPGSVIIITTRDQRLLDWLGIDKVYRLEKLNDRESVELFSWHAFKEPFPTEEFVGLTSKVVSYCGGLPLALEVLGSHLFKRGVQEWISVLEKLKNIPNKQIQKKLKISFDGLNDDEDREIFLDIAFFFIGMDKDEVIDILNGCGYSAEIGISVLRERCLVTVDAKNKLRMHYLLRDMGREIIRESLPLPEERSRLWNPEEVLDVLSKDMGTKAIQGIALKLSRMKPIHLKTNAFGKMKRLRLLQLVGVQLDGDFRYLSTDIRWLSWHGCSSQYATAGFDQANLVAIDFKYSSLQLVWKKSQMLMKLEILNLSHSQYLTETPDFSNIPNLKKLILKYCSRLSLVSHTIGDLKKILLVNLKGCTSLRALPRSIYKLKSLKTLILSGCSEIDKLEEDLEQMESLTTLMANETAITQVPNALVRLKSIVYVSLCGFEGLSRNVFPSIIWSWSSPTDNLSPQMQTYANASWLVSLTMPNNSFHGTSSIIGELPNIQSIRLESGSPMQTTGDVTLDAIKVRNCKELEAAPAMSHVSNMDTSALVDCHIQGDMSTSKPTVSFTLIQMGTNCPVTKILIESISQKMGAGTSDVGKCLLPGDNNTDWLSFIGEGSSLIFEVPKVKGRNLKAMTLCIVYSSPDIMKYEGLILKNLLIINHTKTTPYLYEGDTLISLRDEDWQSAVSNLEGGDKVQVVVVLGDGIIAKSIAVYLMHDESSIEQNIDQCQEDVIVSCGDDMVDNNKNYSGVDDIDEDKNFNANDDDGDKRENAFSDHGVNRIAVDKREDASNVDDMRDKNFSVPTADATPANNIDVHVSGINKKFKLSDKLICFNCYRAN